MQPENLRFGGGASETILHPLILVALLVTILLILFLPRKYLLIPVLSMFFLVPMGQEVLIGVLHFYTYRMIILAIAVRMLLARFMFPAENVLGSSKGTLDLVFVSWALFRAVAGILTFLQTAAVIYQVGFLLDAIGGYFVLRYLFHDDEDVRRAIRVLAVVAVVICICMVYERKTTVDLFGILGGVRTDPSVREGVIRSHGPFEHELLAGTFGATLLPLFLLLWKSGRSRILAILGAIAATGITITSGSSTPVLAYAAAVLAVCAWPLRRRMRLVRWGLLAGLLALSMVMKAPVWFLLQHLNLLGGSSGYQRAMLINDFITHFGDWWLIGTSQNHTWGFTMWDTLNQYVQEGEVGGLVTFATFIALIVICFSKIGRARKAVEGDRSKEWYFWLLGSALFSHVVAYFGVSYFDQIRFLWFALLAMITASTAPYIVTANVPSTAARQGYRPAPARPAFGRLSPSPVKKALPAVRNPYRLSYRTSTLSSNWPKGQ